MDGRLAISGIAKMLFDNRGCVALTGAGISTESGIPDFRSPGTGLYSQIDPMDYLSTRALHGSPERFWKYFAAVFGPVTQAPPNAGHQVLARLEEAGFLSAVVTQNIDGLHQKAGSRTVLEVRGHLRTARCEKCDQHFPLETALDQVVEGKLPACPESDCSGRLRPDVVLFGDMMPPAFSMASEAVKTSRALLVVGSSLMVSPVNSLAFQVDHLAIINREPTPADDRAETVINGSAGEVLLAVEEELRKLL